MGLSTFGSAVKGLARCYGFYAFSIASLSAPAAGGVESRDTFRLVWVRGANASSCPGQLEVERQVRARLGRDPLEVDADRIIDVRVGSDGVSWHVDLAVKDNIGTDLGHRRLDVTAGNCGEVVDAVSLAVALAIDPNLPFQAKAPVAASDAEPSVDAPTVSPPPSAAPVTSSAPYRQPIPEGTCPPPDSSDHRDRYRYELTLRGVAAAGVLPGVAGGTSVAGAFGRDGAQLTLALLYLPESTRNGFAYGLAAVSSGLCFDAVRTRRLATSLCGEFALGAMHAVVYRLEPLHPGDRVTVAVGLGPKFGWNGWAPLHLEVGVSAWAGLVRPKFSVETADFSATRTEFQSSPVSVTGFVGLGVATP